MCLEPLQYLLKSVVVNSGYMFKLPGNSRENCQCVGPTSSQLKLNLLGKEAGGYSKKFQFQVPTMILIPRRVRILI